MGGEQLKEVLCISIRIGYMHTEGCVLSGDIALPPN